MQQNGPPILDMPSDFPTQESWELELHVGILDNKYRAQHEGQPSEQWRAFTSAMNGLRVRFRVMTEAETTYVATVPQSNDTRENVYRQDEGLFSFFTNALSALETLCFLCFALAAQLRPTAFPMATEQDQRRINPTFVLKRFELIFPKDAITKAIAAIVSDPVLQEVQDTRNILSHRGNPPRHYNVNLSVNPGIAPQHKFLGGSKGDPPQWNGITLDANALDKKRKTIARYVTTTIVAALEFARENIKK